MTPTTVTSTMEMKETLLEKKGELVKFGEEIKELGSEIVRIQSEVLSAFEEMVNSGPGGKWGGDLLYFGRNKYNIVNIVEEKYSIENENKLDFSFTYNALLDLMEVRLVFDYLGEKYPYTKEDEKIFISDIDLKFFNLFQKTIVGDIFTLIPGSVDERFHNSTKKAVDYISGRVKEHFSQI